jgi:hypothetical protein
MRDNSNPEGPLTSSTEDEPSRVATRSELLPEERAAGSDDPEGQAAEILAESDARQEAASRAADKSAEHRRSEDTVEP